MIAYWGHYEEIIYSKVVENISYFVFEVGKCSERVLEFVIENKIKYYFIKNSEDMLRVINDNPIPRLTLVGSFGLIFTEEMIVQLNKNIVNIHPGILPNYRGRHPLPQAILNKERFMGITSHILTKCIDKGDIIEIRAMSIDYDASYFDNLNRLYSLLPELIDVTVEKFLKNCLPIIVSDTNDNYYPPLNEITIKEIVNCKKLIEITDRMEEVNEKDSN